ncbi:CRISPR-associated exonuclease Cas4 [Peptoclostridium litorale DSM 5388]|uniref:CRISPR-associated exonuclease Cas4 n=1 Tax=Peptoclostridium litorale DSM 5388 TaxID=1121324 RepID=A0A069RI97_PEPLI|nr:CRISPR-associated protein Cas4 [Peptoclostridium litorale]KDR96749.1 CRISPR-associated protein Cas4 [Peptoclostridium litorale DSM 5388]SIO34857.1 CRISPR-associated exonuclease Cas4 [Peptoclostridium litorale DSM 5388]
MKYSEDEMLMLSGIQHFYFCKRQWALIHVENQWVENVRTIEGKHIHEKADDPFIVETRGDIVIARSVPVSSSEIGLYGIADVIEFRRTKNEGVSFSDKEGLWMPVPVEYKRGEPKDDARDEVQLCAQAMCLEEMLGLKIEKGYIFYNSIKRRTEVDFDKGLRASVIKLSKEMHSMFNEKKTPKARREKYCRACSMEEVCQPKVTGKRCRVKDYIKKGLAEE